jgi:hypothetical protein
MLIHHSLPFSIHCVFRVMLDFASLCIFFFEDQKIEIGFSPLSGFVHFDRVIVCIVSDTLQLSSEAYEWCGLSL